MRQNAETRLPRSFLRAEQSRYLHVLSYLYMYQFDASQYGTSTSQTLR